MKIHPEKTRWETPEGLAKARQIIELIRGDKINDAFMMTGKVQGRFDLRGLTLATRTKPVETASVSVKDSRFDIVPTTTYHSIALRSVDFSSTSFERTWWEDCSFADCLFDHSRLHDVRLKGCDIVDCHFIESRISSSLLGGSNATSLGSIEGSVFEGGTFSEVNFDFPRISRCHFLCDLTNVDFDGSQLSDCRFTGTMKGVKFRGKGWLSSNDSYLKEDDVPINKMENIDFSEATFDDIEFRNGVDLTKCKLPAKGGVVLVLNAQKVFHEALAIIETDWSGEHQRIASSMIRGYYYKQIENGQTQFILKRDNLEKSLGHEYASRFISLITGVPRA